jgi:hypothetical protein
VLGEAFGMAALYHRNSINIIYTRQSMSLEKFFNIKPKPAQERMDVENPEKESLLPWVEK